MLTSRHRFVAQLASRGWASFFTYQVLRISDVFASLFAKQPMNEPDSRWFEAKRNECRKIGATLGRAAVVERRFLSVPE